MFLRSILILFFFNLIFAQSICAYNEIWKASDLEPSQDDHWRHQPIKRLSDEFLERLLVVNQKQFKTLEEVRAATQMLLPDQGTMEEQGFIKTGDFIFNENLLLGHGVEGRVCLAQHIPTGSFVAMKQTGRKSEFEAFKNLKRCFGCYQEEDRYFIYTPLIIGKPLFDYSVFPKNLLEMEASQTGNVVYKNWLLNLRLIDAYLAEVRRCIRLEGIPQEYNSNSMFVVGETLLNPQVVFVDLESGTYRTQDKDIIPDVFCVGLKYLLGSKIITPVREPVFPKPVAEFFASLDKVSDQNIVRLTKLFELLTILERDMQECGYPIEVEALKQ